MQCAEVILPAFFLCAFSHMLEEILRHLFTSIRFRLPIRNLRFATKFSSCKRESMQGQVHQINEVRAMLNDKFCLHLFQILVRCFIWIFHEKRVSKMRGTETRSVDGARIPTVFLGFLRQLHLINQLDVKETNLDLF